MHEYLSNPKILQFEISSMCNVLCLGCVRTASNFNTKKSVIEDKHYLKIENFKRLIIQFGSIERVEFCGTIDEPMMHPQFLDMIEFLVSVGIRFHVHTNGSLRNKSDWTKLGKLSRDNGVVNFSIDGFKEEHEFYRQKSNYEKIIENAQAFLDAGGIANWQMVVFPWNEHQIEDCRQKSVKMGFKKFKVRQDRSIVSELGKEGIIERKKLNLPEPTYHAFKVSPEEETSEIKCNFREKEMYFVSHDSRLWPCCFLANGFLKQGAQRDILEKRIYHQYGKDFNNLNVYTPEEILQSNFYKKDLVMSFESKCVGVNKTDRISRCAETCSKPKWSKHNG